jgi:hypothetical protein
MTSGATLVQRTRRYLRDWRDYDALAVSVASSSTSLVSLVVSNTNIYMPRWPVEIDQEAYIIRSVDSSTYLTALPGAFGSARTSHAASTSILIRPNYYANEILDAVNEAIMAMFPAVYKPVVDTTSTALANQYSYSIPSMPGYTNYPIPYIYRVETLVPGDYRFRSSSRWEVVRGASTSTSTVGTLNSSLSPAIRFRGLPYTGSTLAVYGFGPFPPLSGINDTLDPLFPPGAEYLIPIYAAGSLLMSGEAARVRISSEAVDDREQANRAGSSSNIGLQLLNRFRNELLQGSASSAMPPMPGT